MPTHRLATTVYLDKHTKQLAEQRASKDGRSLSNWIERLILKAVTSAYPQDKSA